MAKLQKRSLAAVEDHELSIRRQVTGSHVSLQPPNLTYEYHFSVTTCLAAGDSIRYLKVMRPKSRNADCVNGCIEDVGRHYWSGTTARYSALAVAQSDSSVCISKAGARKSADTAGSH